MTEPARITYTLVPSDLADLLFVTGPKGLREEYAEWATSASDAGMELPEDFLQFFLHAYALNDHSWRSALNPAYARKFPPATNEWVTLCRAILSKLGEVSTEGLNSWHFHMVSQAPFPHLSAEAWVWFGERTRLGDARVNEVPPQELIDMVKHGAFVAVDVEGHKKFVYPVPTEVDAQRAFETEMILAYPSQFDHIAMTDADVRTKFARDPAVQELLALRDLRQKFPTVGWRKSRTRSGTFVGGLGNGYAWVVCTRQAVAADSSKLMFGGEMRFSDKVDWATAIGKDEAAAISALYTLPRAVEFAFSVQYARSLDDMLRRMRDLLEPAHAATTALAKYLIPGAP
jgi:hypothetical protein